MSITAIQELEHGILEYIQSTQCIGSLLTPQGQIKTLLEPKYLEAINALDHHYKRNEKRLDYIWKTVLSSSSRRIINHPCCSRTQSSGKT